jgi:hypothetical protein
LLAAPVNITPMADLDDDHHENVILDLVNDAV